VEYEEELESQYGKDVADKIVAVASVLRDGWEEDEAVAESKIGLYSPVPLWSSFIEEAVDLLENNPQLFEEMLKQAEIDDAAWKKVGFERTFTSGNCEALIKGTTRTETRFGLRDSTRLASFCVF